MNNLSDEDEVEASYHYVHNAFQPSEPEDNEDKDDEENTQEDDDGDNVPFQEGMVMSREMGYQCAERVLTYTFGTYALLFLSLQKSHKIVSDSLLKRQFKCVVKQRTSREIRSERHILLT